MRKPIAKFEIIDNVGRAYEYTWRERSYLLRLALVPIVVKLLCYYAAMLYVEPQNITKLALFLLPAYFVEGWMIAHWARTIMLNHRWPFVPSGDLVADQKEMELRSKGIIGGAVTFAAINFLMAGFFAAVFSAMPPDIKPEEATPEMGTLALVVLIAMFFLFRFAWIYIPLSVGVSAKRYIKMTSAVSFTFSLIALWLVCFIPPVMVMQFIGGIFVGLGGSESGDPTAMGEVFLAGVRVVFDTLKNILVTAGISFALMEVFQWKKT